MKRPGFSNGVIVALALAFLASVGFTILAPILALGLLVKLFVPALALSYILYLFSRSSERVGRVTTLAIWALLSAALWIVEPPVAYYILFHVGAIWLIRSLYFYSSLVPAFIDLCLNILSVGTAYWAMRHSGSTFLAVWCFFLVQALFVAIPPALNRKAGNKKNVDADTATFTRAQRRAEAAVRQLFSQ